MCLFSFALKVKNYVVSDTLSYTFHLWLTAAMQRKPKSYSSSLMDQIPIKFLIRQAQGLQQELGGICFTCFLLLTFIGKTYFTVYNVIMCNRCSVLKIQIVSLPANQLFPLKPPAVLFWCVISDIFFYRLNHMKLQVFNYFWLTKMPFHMIEANRYMSKKFFL